MTLPPRTPREGTRPTVDCNIGAVVGPLPPAGAGITFKPGAVPSCAPFPAFDQSRVEFFHDRATIGQFVAAFQAVAL